MLTGELKREEAPGWFHYPGARNYNQLASGSTSITRTQLSYYNYRTGLRRLTSKKISSLSLLGFVLLNNVPGSTIAGLLRNTNQL